MLLYGFSRRLIVRGSENDGSNKQGTGNNVPEEANIYENEINLIDYFRVVCKRKWFILLGSIIPTLLVGLIIFFLPRHYTITYTYDVEDQPKDQLKDQLKDQFARRITVDINNWDLGQKNYNILLNRFYSKENLSKITTRLQQEGLSQYAKLISRARGLKGLEKLVKYEAVPPYIDMAKTNQTDPAKLKGIRQLKAQLLNVTITGTILKDVSKISLVIRDNLENIIPVYLIAEQLDAGIRLLRANMADIEKEKFALQLVLNKSKSILVKLKNVRIESVDRGASGIVLQFDVGGRSEYLPIEYQIQTAESKIIQLEEGIKDNEKKYEYYEDLLSLNEKLLAQIRSRSSSAYTIRQFQSFLIESTKDVEQQELKDYLNSYVKGVENRIAVSAPITEEPRIYAVSRGTVKKTIIVFVVLLMLTTLAAFLLEGIKKSQAQAS